VVQDNRETTAIRVREVIARELCAVVYRNGRVGRRFEMPIDHLPKEIGLGFSEFEKAIDLAESRGWIRRSRSSVTLKATGIYVAKRVLYLDSGDDT
jgi:hypothetical protein